MRRVSCLAVRLSKSNMARPTLPHEQLVREPLGGTSRLNRLLGWSSTAVGCEFRLGRGETRPPRDSSTDCQGAHPKATEANIDPGIVDARSMLRLTWISCGSYRQQARPACALWWEDHWSQRQIRTRNLRSGPRAPTASKRPRQNSARRVV
jgi:hypothetical protein